MKNVKKVIAITLSGLMILSATLYFSFKPATLSSSQSKSGQCSNPHCTCTNCICGSYCTCKEDKK